MNLVLHRNPWRVLNTKNDGGMMVVRDSYGKWKKLGVYSVIALLTYAGIRFLAGALFPFLAAFVLLKLCYPAALWMKRRFRINQGIGVLIILIITVGIVGIGLWLLMQTIFSQLGELCRKVSAYEQHIEAFWGQCCCRIEQYLGLDADYISRYLPEHFHEMIGRFGTYIGKGALQYSCRYAKGIVKIVGAVVVIVAVTVLAAKDYDGLCSRLKQNAFYPDVKRLCYKVFRAAFVYVRAQLLLISLISALCIATLLAVGCPQAVLIGIGIGILDALPFFGTGAVLVPWALVKVLGGKIVFAAVLGTLYLVCSFVREFLEPKLIGSSLGIMPVYVISSIYVGIVLYGVAGVVLGPLQVMVTWEVGRQWIEEHSVQEVQKTD